MKLIEKLNALFTKTEEQKEQESPLPDQEAKKRFDQKKVNFDTTLQETKSLLDQEKRLGNKQVKSLPEA